MSAADWPGHDERSGETSTVVRVPFRQRHQYLLGNHRALQLPRRYRRIVLDLQAFERRWEGQGVALRAPARSAPRAGASHVQHHRLCVRGLGVDQLPVHQAAAR